MPQAPTLEVRSLLEETRSECCRRDSPLDTKPARLPASLISKGIEPIIPLAVLLWWQPKMMRQILEKRLQWKRRELMSHGKVLALSILAAARLMCAQGAPAQVSIGVNIGAAPVCPYGYFDYAPYDCAPYAYYGPDWFVGGVFLGAGPWFHGPRGFFGHVDNRYDPHYGYHGPLPGRGEAPFNHFHGNEARDGRGHIGPAGHDVGNEHALPGYRGGGSRGGSHGGGHH
jgi:hypothetical protein